MDGVGYRTALRVVKLINVLVMTALFGVCWYLAYADNIRSPFYNKGNWVVIAIFAVLYLVYGRVYDAFKVSLYRISEMVYSQALSLLLSDAILYVVIWLLNKDIPPVWPLLLCAVLQILAAVAWSYFGHNGISRPSRPGVPPLSMTGAAGWNSSSGNTGWRKNFRW